MGYGRSVPSRAQVEPCLNDLGSPDSASTNFGRFILSEAEFCKAVGISRTTAYRLRESRSISYCIVGNRIFYLPKHIEEFFENCERPSRHAKRSSKRGGQIESL